MDGKNISKGFKSLFAWKSGEEGVANKTVLLYALGHQESGNVRLRLEEIVTGGR